MHPEKRCCSQRAKQGLYSFYRIQRVRILAFGSGLRKRFLRMARIDFIGPRETASFAGRVASAGKSLL
ncbi:MAG: hypothetical protein D4R65_02370 [Verrucomicrobiaceae bacterium]|nr:MAG: hypothetical protein D4R65_02370 [Verrucomicrobiaceae bacterium]